MTKDSKNEEEETKDLNVDDQSSLTLPTIDNSKDVRVAVIGNVDSGKSTLVGVLTKNIIDDGRGYARTKVFNFSHEAANGRTSSIGQEVMGFKENFDQVELARANATKNQAWAHVANES